VIVHTEYGVLLPGGTIAPAASAAVAVDYPHGWPVCHRIASTPCGRGGDAVVEIGPWIALRGSDS
jgi:hypothetical protein